MKNEMSRFAPVSHFTQGYPIFHYMLLSDLFLYYKMGAKLVLQSGTVSLYYKTRQMLLQSRIGIPN